MTLNKVIAKLEVLKKQFPEAGDYEIIVSDSDLYLNIPDDLLIFDELKEIYI